MALAGSDGAQLAKLLGQSKSYGVKIMAQVVGDAIRRWKGTGHILLPPDQRKIGLAIAAVNSTADLLGRFRVRELAERAQAYGDNQRPQDAPFAAFADSLPGVLSTPEAAVAFFMSRRPELGIDPHRYGELQRRQAFTLAASTNLLLTQKLQKVIGDAFRANKSTSDAQRQIKEALEAAGVNPKNPQYSEMLFRTNVMDSYQQGAYDEGRHEDNKDTFPVWQYLGIDDERTGEDHRPKFDRYYPRAAAFSEVRGKRVYNCRCSLKWIDKFEWSKLQETGHAEEHQW